ncbi:MAG: hypothetical protein QOG43_364 [Actinomycetota bacterium]|nr:hypothetical protein [Actinomycetota bacterium]
MTQHDRSQEDEIDLGDLVEEIAGAGVTPVDEQPEPKVVPAVDFYVYRAQRAVMRAIRLQSRSDGLGDATDARAAEARLDAAAGLAQERVRHGNVQIQTLDRLLDKAYTVLGSWQGRAWWDTRRKLAFWAIVLVADTGTIAGIAYSVGDPLFLAVPFGLGAGASAITLGLLAADHRKHKERARRADHQPPDCDEFAGFFVADIHGSRVQVVFGAAMLVLLAGVLTLRIGASGDPVLGVGFGFVAAASFLASWVSSWYHTCEIRDYLDTLEQWRDAVAARQDPEVRIIGARDEARSKADTLVQMGVLTGKAGAQAAKARIIAGGPMENPAVYGHGTAPAGDRSAAPPAGTVGISSGNGHRRPVSSRS